MKTTTEERSLLRTETVDQLARDIFQRLGIPVGIIDSTWGGTVVESWMSPAALAGDPAFTIVGPRWQKMQADYPRAKAEYEAAVAEWLNEQVQIKHGIATEFLDDGKAKPLDDSVKVVLFRNFRELLANCIKHAKAETIRVNIRRIDNSIK